MLPSARPAHPTQFGYAINVARSATAALLRGAADVCDAQTARARMDDALGRLNRELEVAKSLLAGCEWRFAPTAAQAPRFGVPPVPSDGPHLDVEVCEGTHAPLVEAVAALRNAIIASHDVVRLHAGLCFDLDDGSDASGTGGDLKAGSDGELGPTGGKPVEIEPG
jgi:hypothetical protein